MPHYKLYYFDIQGLAEPIRLTFAQAGVPFEDVRFTMEEWPQYKEKMPFGQAPVLEVDGKQLTQWMAISRYLGRKYGLEANDEWDRAVGDELATSWLDVFQRLLPSWTEDDMEKKKQFFLKVIEEFIFPRMKIFDELLSHSKSGFVSGPKVTWCDFAFYNWLTMIRDYLTQSLESYPHLDKFMHKVENLPKIKEWHDRHAGTKFTVFPSPFGD